MKIMRKISWKILFLLTCFQASEAIAQQVLCTLAPTSIPVTPPQTFPPASAETPASIACVYGLTPNIPGCPINQTSITPTGGSGTIVVTEGGHDPNAEEELAIFSAAFNLPSCTSTPAVPGQQPCFSVYYANTTGNVPPDATGKDLREHALDIEMVHAMAPNAKIIMVEADSFDQPTIFNAVYCANQILSAQGGGTVSNSWSKSEYPGETINDVYFHAPGIVYTASSGDFLAPARYPSSSPYVISVGGTRFERDAQGLFKREIYWFSPESGLGTSGGPSLYEARPTFQNSVMKVVGNARGTPDIAAIAINIAFYYINGTDGIWEASGGTSFASPIMAGIINSAGSHAGSTQAELSLIYNGALKNYHAYWHDILKGNNGFPALQGYDFVTGLGSPAGYAGK
jgi:kumamolisin